MAGKREMITVTFITGTRCCLGWWRGTFSRVTTQGNVSLFFLVKLNKWIFYAFSDTNLKKNYKFSNTKIIKWIRTMLSTKEILNKN